MITTPLSPFELKRLLISDYKQAANDEDPSTIFWVIMDDVVRYLTRREKLQQYRTIIIERINYLNMVRKGVQCNNVTTISKDDEDNKEITFAIAKIGGIPIFKISYHNSEFKVIIIAVSVQISECYLNSKTTMARWDSLANEKLTRISRKRVSSSLEKYTLLRKKLEI